MGMGTRVHRPSTLLRASAVLNVLLLGALLLRQQAATLPGASSTRVQASAGDPARLWLIIGLPTLPRSGADYLTPTIEALDDELSATAAMQANVQVLTMSLAAQHSAFDRLKARFGAGSGGAHARFRFEYAPTQWGDEADDGDPRDRGTRDHPGYRVRKQTRHFALLLRLAGIWAPPSDRATVPVSPPRPAPCHRPTLVGLNNHRAGNSSDYFLTMEDDFLACPSLLPALVHLTHKAHRWAGDWIAIRLSYGLAGVLLRGKDLLPLASYVSSRRRMRPPDHLLVEWFAGETAASKAYRGERRNLAFRYNLLDHIGARSTLREEASPSYPHCYEPLRPPVLFEVEAFSEADCPQEDLWPCAPSGAGKVLPRISLPSPSYEPKGRRRGSSRPHGYATRLE